jgi:transposase-like protein
MKRKRKDPMSIPNLTLEQRTAFADLLASKDQDVLKEMLSLVYDAAIKAQFDQHIGAEPHERTNDRRDHRNGSRTRGLNTRPGSLDLEIPRPEIVTFGRLSSSSFAAPNVRSCR